MALNSRQNRFVQEYLKNPVGSDAAVAAGYAPKNARQSAGQLMAMPEVAAAIVAGQAAVAAKNAITVDWIVERLRTVAESNIKGDKIKALELLGRYVRMFKERIEHSGPCGGPIPGAFEIRFVRPARDGDSSG